MTDWKDVSLIVTPKELAQIMNIKEHEARRFYHVPGFPRIKRNQKATSRKRSTSKIFEGRITNEEINQENHRSRNNRSNGKDNANGHQLR